MACHSDPLFLKVPSSSFFLQSTEMIGSPRCSNCLPLLLICSNWASRSGCEVPSMVFLLARKANPRSCKMSASADFLSLLPFGCQSLDQVRQRLARPLDKAHRISFGLQLLLSIRKQRRVGLHPFFHASTRLADALAWPIPLTCLQFFQAPLHRIDRDACERAATWLTLSRLCASAARYCLHCFSLSIWRICWYSCSIESFSMRSA